MWLLLSWHYDCAISKIKKEVEETGLLGTVNEVLSEYAWLTQPQPGQ